jgi:hypothetical protein
MNPTNNFVNYLCKDYETRLAHHSLTEDSPLIHQLVNGGTVGTFLAAWYRMGKEARSEKDYELGEWLLHSTRSQLLDACLIMFVAGVKDRSWTAAIGLLIKTPRSACPPACGSSGSNTPGQPSPQQQPQSAASPKESPLQRRVKAARKRLKRASHR